MDDEIYLFARNYNMSIKDYDDKHQIIASEELYQDIVMQMKLYMDILGSKKICV